MTMSDNNQNKSNWDTIDKMVRVISLVAIPVVLAIFGYIVQSNIKNQEVSQNYVQLSISLLTRDDQANVHPEIRGWAVELLDDHSPIKFNPDVKAAIKKGDISLSTTFEVFKTTGSSGVAYSPDGRRIAFGDESGTIKVINPATGALVQKLTGHERKVIGVSFDPLGLRLASISINGIVHLWDIETGQITLTIKETNQASGVSFSPDGKNLAILSVDGNLTMYDIQSGNRMLEMK